MQPINSWFYLYLICGFGAWSQFWREPSKFSLCLRCKFALSCRWKRLVGRYRVLIYGLVDLARELYCCMHGLRLNIFTCYFGWTLIKLRTLTEHMLFHFGICPNAIFWTVDVGICRGIQHCKVLKVVLAFKQHSSAIKCHASQSRFVSKDLMNNLRYCIVVFKFYERVLYCLALL